MPREDDKLNEVGKLIDLMRQKRVVAFEGLGVKVQLSPLAFVESRPAAKPKAKGKEEPRQGLAGRFPDEDPDLFHAVERGH